MENTHGSVSLKRGTVLFDQDSISVCFEIQSLDYTNIFYNFFCGGVLKFPAKHPVLLFALIDQPDTENRIYFGGYFSKAVALKQDMAYLFRQVWLRLPLFLVKPLVIAVIYHPLIGV